MYSNHMVQSRVRGFLHLVAASMSMFAFRALTLVFRAVRLVTVFRIFLRVFLVRSLVTTTVLTSLMFLSDGLYKICDCDT
jgi:hypothetical protein